MAVIKDFSTNYMKPLGLNQAYMYTRMFIKLRINYYIVFYMFLWIDNGKYITAINKKFIRFFFIWITQMIFD